MPIKSYLAFSTPERFDRLVERLCATPGCEVTPAENRALAVLVTDTQDREAEDALLARLEQIEELQCLTLVHGHFEPEGSPT